MEANVGSGDGVVVVDEERWSGLAWVMGVSKLAESVLKDIKGDGVGPNGLELGRLFVAGVLSNMFGLPNSWIFIEKGNGVSRKWGNGVSRMDVSDIRDRLIESSSRVFESRSLSSWDSSEAVGKWICFPSLEK